MTFYFRLWERMLNKSNKQTEINLLPPISQLASQRNTVAYRRHMDKSKLTSLHQFFKTFYLFFVSLTSYTSIPFISCLCISALCPRFPTLIKFKRKKEKEKKKKGRNLVIEACRVT